MADHRADPAARSLPRPMALRDNRCLTVEKGARRVSIDISRIMCDKSKNDEGAAFDPFEGPFHLDPSEAACRSRARAPAFFSPKLGCPVTGRYEDVQAGSRDNTAFPPWIAFEKVTPLTGEASTTLA